MVLTIEIEAAIDHLAEEITWAFWKSIARNDVFRHLNGEVSIMARTSRNSKSKQQKGVSLDWKKVVWKRPDFTPEAIAVINKLVASDDFDLAWELGVLVHQGSHLKLSPEDGGKLRLSCTFPDDPEDTTRWFGVSATSTTIQHAVAGVLWRIDFVRESEEQRGSVDNPGGLE